MQFQWVLYNKQEYVKQCGLSKCGKALLLAEEAKWEQFNFVQTLLIDSQ